MGLNEQGSTSPDVVGTTATIEVLTLATSGKPDLQSFRSLVSSPWPPVLLGGSWDLVSTVISTLSGVISNYKYSYLNYNPSY